jgi:hypothetical protein
MNKIVAASSGEPEARLRRFCCELPDGELIFKRRRGAPYHYVVGCFKRLPGSSKPSIHVFRWTEFALEAHRARAEVADHDFVTGTFIMSAVKDVS